MPSSLECVGHISPEIFLDSLNRKRLNGQEVVVVSFLPVHHAHWSLKNHMKQTGRVIVVEPFSEVMEDFHLVLSKKDTVLRDVIPFSPQNTCKDIVLFRLICLRFFNFSKSLDFKNAKDDLLLGVAGFRNSD